VSKVHFIGAGPGDPELITVKGARLLGEAGVVIYAGSLVDRELVRCHAPEAQVYDSSVMTLEETTAAISEGVLANRQWCDSTPATLHLAIQEANGRTGPPRH
jgi:precorrin-4/cobalt-precorrin-4 C11-methyltransferase